MTRVIKSCCSRPESEHVGVVCPDGLIPCAVCEERVPGEQLSADEDGGVVNVCVYCDIASELAS